MVRARVLKHVLSLIYQNQFTKLKLFYIQVETVFQADIAINEKDLPTKSQTFRISGRFGLPGSIPTQFKDFILPHRRKRKAKWGVWRLRQHYAKWGLKFSEIMKSSHSLNPPQLKHWVSQASSFVEQDMTTQRAQWQSTLQSPSSVVSISTVSVLHGQLKSKSTK